MDAQKRIKQLMEERGWTDYRLAKEANLSHSTITNVFKRNNAPTLPTLEVICRAFGITLYGYGQKDYRGSGSFTAYVQYRDGEFVEIEKCDLVRALNELSN